MKGSEVALWAGKWEKLFERVIPRNEHLGRSGDFLNAPFHEKPGNRCV